MDAMPVLGYIEGMQGKLITAARALLGMSQRELSEKAKVSRPTLVSLEGDKGNPTRNSERDVIAALEAAGIVFEETGERIGVYLKRSR
jgi:DNA-binding XRE family transcriptional regulator